MTAQDEQDAQPNNSNVHSHQREGQNNYPWLAHYPEALSWQIDIPVTPVFTLLDNTAREYGHCPAFDFLGKKWRWAAIAAQVARLAKGLQQQGVGKGVKVGLFLPNTPYFLIAYYAILKAGGTVVNYNPLYSVHELAHQIKDSGTSIMITADLAVLCEKIDQVMEKAPLDKLVLCRFTRILPFPKNILFELVKGKELSVPEAADKTLWYDDLVNNDGQPEPVTIDPAEDIAVLQYTGGTTGTPKGAMLTHANITANVEQSSNWFYKARPGEEKMLGVLPFFHVFAMTAVLNMSVRNAFEIIALPRFDLNQTLKLIHRKKPHYFPAVPAIYNAINNHKDKKKYNLSSLRYCISGGAPLPVEVKKNFEGETGCIVVEGYGLTESAPVACVNPIEGLNKAGSIGFPVQNTVIEIIDTETGKEAAPGERGELCIRGPQVMKGYWEKPEDTAEVFKDGRLHTGDIAMIDEQGYIYIVDRIKDLIITNGYNVYPRSVEEAIYLHAGVEECIVAGLPDKARGEIVKAWVKPRTGYEDISAEELTVFLKDKLSKIQIPRQIEIRQEPLPKTMIGKLSRKDILEQEKESSGK